MTTPQKKLTKAAILAEVAKTTGLSQKDTDSVLAALATVVQKQLGAKGPGEVTVPYLVKLKTRSTPAQPEKQGVNPFTKQPITIKAKPASFKVRAAPVKALRDALTQA